MKQCKLCLRHVDKLEDSHFLPAGIYRILRDDKEKNPNPYLLTGKTAVQIQRQMKAPLLCSDCEQRFNKFGEDWVLKHCLQKDGSFPLASILATRTPDVSVQTTMRLYCASKIPEIDVSALAYFATSIFWRGSIHPWNTDGAIPVQLGPFQEPFRQYLMGLQAYPKDCSSLWVVVREGKETDRLTYPPVGKGSGKLHVYRFPMPGFCFILAISKNIPAYVSEKCFVSGHGNPIFVTNSLEPLLRNEGIEMKRRSRRLP
jgi:hypothetical protein